MLRLEACGGGNKRSRELMDALPYVDGLNAQSRQVVDALIEEEAQRSGKHPRCVRGWVRLLCMPLVHNA